MSTRVRLAALLFLVLCAFVGGAHAQDASCLSAHENAQRLRRSGQFLEAHRELLICAQAGCPRVVRNQCTAWENELAASTPSLVFGVASSVGADLVDVHVLGNGKLLSDRLDGRAVAVDPGVYELRFEAANHAPKELSITVREGEKNRLVQVQLERDRAVTTAPAINEDVSAYDVAAPKPQSNLRSRAEEPRASTHVWPASAIVLGSLTLASAGTSLGFGLWGKHKYDELHDSGCGKAKTCTDRDIQSGQRAYIVADVFAGVAAASLVSALWIYIRANREDTKTPRVDAALDRDGLRLSFTKAF